MTNYNYNGMNAQDIANKIIAKEEAYENACYDLMPFEVKCKYALELTPIIHPTIPPDSSERRELLDALRPELLRRADEEDAFALYVLGNTCSDLSTPPTDTERQFLERSMNAGYIPAAFSLLDLFYHGKRASEPEAVRIREWIREHITEKESEDLLYAYCRLIDDEARSLELALCLAADGDFNAVSYLAHKAPEGRDFWKGVRSTVLNHFRADH